MTFILPRFSTAVGVGVVVEPGLPVTLDVEMGVLQETVAVVGARAELRSVTASPVPVDVIRAEDLTRPVGGA